MPSRFLIMAARLVALDLLPGQVGHEMISIFIRFSDLRLSRSFSKFAGLHLVELAAGPALRYGQYDERYGIPPRTKAEVPSCHDADGDGDAMRQREPGKRVVERLVHVSSILLERSDHNTP